MRTVINGTQGFRDVAGTHIGWSDWLQIDQARIDTFADATGDHQWIHVDPERAAGGPFGTTIAHGYLTLSIAPVLLSSVMSVEGMTFGINYGCNKVRFPSPVTVGSRLRLGAEVSDVADVEGGVQATLKLTLEIEGGTKPACVAEVVYRYYL